MKYIIFLPLLIIVSSCATMSELFEIKKLFTQDYRERIETSNHKNVERIQYFNDQKIVLYRESAIKNEEITAGKVVFEDGLYKYLITINKNTPAVAKYHDSITLKIYFEEGENYFYFKKDYDGHYELFGDEKTNSTSMDYYGYDWEQVEGSNARLLFQDANKATNKSDKKTLQGIKIIE